MSKQGFKELQVWQRAKKLAVNVYKLTTGDSMARQCALADQMRRSSISVPSNIAEGDERDNDKDFVRFFYIANGSLAELITPLSTECIELGRVLGALIKAHSVVNPTYRLSP